MMKETTACWEMPDEQSFHEMLNCAKVTGLADSICCRLNLKITAAEPSPVEELSSSNSSSTARATGTRHSRKKLSFEIPPNGEHISLNESRQVTTLSSPLESYIASQQEAIKRQTLKMEAIKRKIDAYKGERTAIALISSLPVCRKCHLREEHTELPLSSGLFVFSVLQEYRQTARRKSSPQGTHQTRD